MTTLWIILGGAGYILIGMAVRRAIICAHYLGYGEAPPKKRANKTALLWVWYVTTWALQWLYMEIVDQRRAKIAEDNWWCPECAEWVPCENVTFEERHDPRAGGCGYEVERR